MQAVCDLCDEKGPRIHRNAGGSVGLWPSIGGDIFNESEIMAEWNRWIQEHTFCDFKVVFSA